ncbi:MAG: NifU family protein [Rickettsiaceae bacterium H1]|nr:NifU family protein [Rickettsiaceae bacterium H1]
MFIQTEDTPNPNTLKFLPGLTVVEKGTLEFVNEEEAKNSELASLLFKVRGVVGILFGYDFISVTKSAEKKWELMKPDILTLIMEYFTINSGRDILSSNDINIEYDESDNEVVKQIQELIYTRIKPAVMQDGGDIEFKKYKNGVVFLQLKGACSGCPSAAITLKDGIEDMLKYYIPQVQLVQAIE